MKDVKLHHHSQHQYGPVRHEDLELQLLQFIFHMLFSTSTSSSGQIPVHPAAGRDPLSSSSTSRRRQSTGAGAVLSSTKKNRRSLGCSSSQKLNLRNFGKKGCSRELLEAVVFSSTKFSSSKSAMQQFSQKWWFKKL